MSSTVSWSREAVNVVVSAPSSARIRVTARVRDVRLAALAHLAAVGRLGQDVGPAQGFEVGVGVVGAMGVDHVSDGVGEPVAAGGAEERGTAQPAQVEPGAGLPARSARCDVASRHRAWGRRIRGLRVHGHLRLRGPADGVPQGGLGLRRRRSPPSGPVLDATDPDPSDRPPPAERETDHPFERWPAEAAFTPSDSGSAMALKANTFSVLRI
ncbi:hypothetical protein SHKM778_22920 [Streptomyces sp. KM77-8]|uniref:Uncharacterized protein n=1 Tax=Streptomyces haneummycinicus TaxID=3074435 RepID=A0AAT9HES8_9ACTN